MPITINGDGSISGLGDIDGHDLETNTLVVSGDTTLAPQSGTSASLFVDESANTVGINTLTPSASVFLEVADATDPIVRVNNTAGGNLDIGSTTTFGYVQGSSGHELRLGSNGSNTIVLQGDGDVNIDSNTLYVDVSTNRVGIGNNNPGSTFYVTSSDASGFTVSSASAQATDTNKGIHVKNATATDTFSVSYRGQTYVGGRLGVQILSPAFDLHVESTGRSDVACFESNESGRSHVSYRDATTTQDPQVGSAGNALLYRTGYVNRGVIDGSGRLVHGGVAAVPFGTTTPVLQILGPGSTGATGTTFGIAAFNTAGSDPVRLCLAKSRSTTQGGHAALLNNNQIGVIRYMGSDGTTFKDGATILGIAEGNWSPSSNPTRLSFSTTSEGSNTPTVRFSINNKGAGGFGVLPGNDTTFKIERTMTDDSTDNAVTIYQNRLLGILDRNTQPATYVAHQSALLNSGATSPVNVYTYDAIRGTWTGPNATNMFGYHTGNSLTAATNCYGFFGNISEAGGRFNVFVNGTANNFFRRRVLIGNQIQLTAANGVSNQALLTVADNTLSQNIGWMNLHNTAVIQTNYSLGGINFTGYQNIGYSGARIAARATANWNASNSEAELIFSTTPPGSTTPAIRMVLKQNGTLNLNNLPTSSAGLVSGDVWRDGTDLKIVA